MAQVKNFPLEIIRPSSKTIAQVEWVELQGVGGDFVVGPQHCATVSILKDRGKLSYKDSKSQKVESVDVYGGMFKLLDNKATVILDI